MVASSLLADTITPNVAADRSFAREFMRQHHRNERMQKRSDVGR